MRHGRKKCCDDVHRMFQRKGCRLTQARKAIVESLSRIMGHPTAEEVYFEVHKSYPAIGLTTVYRTLELLVDWGIIHKFDFGEGSSRYEMINSPGKPGHHHHLVCKSCHKIIDYDDFADEELALLSKVERVLSKKHKFVINEHKIEFIGLCSICHSKLNN